MKKIEFELFAVVFSLLPLTVYFLNFDIKRSLYGLLTITIAYILESKSRHGDERFMFIPREYSIVVAVLVFLPSAVTFICFHIYDDITDAYWAFAMCCWAFGASLNGFIHALKEN